MLRTKGLTSLMVLSVILWKVLGDGATLEEALAGVLIVPAAFGALYICQSASTAAMKSC